MPFFQISGTNFTTKKFSALTTGTTISFTVPVKSFIIKPVGGVVNLKKAAADDNADAFPIRDGESVAIDLGLQFPIATSVATVGVVFSNSGTVDVYVIAAF